MWCGAVWCGVVWCDVVWCVVWCGLVVWCGVVQWLDIEHTDGKRYFTWDHHLFPGSCLLHLTTLNRGPRSIYLFPLPPPPSQALLLPLNASLGRADPASMINKLAARGRKMVTIIDPHIKRDSGYVLCVWLAAPTCLLLLPPPSSSSPEALSLPSPALFSSLSTMVLFRYFVHKTATDNGYYIKNRHGGDLDGWCWPGSSSYLDFTSYVFSPVHMQPRACAGRTAAERCCFYPCCLLACACRLFVCVCGGGGMSVRQVRAPPLSLHPFVLFVLRCCAPAPRFGTGGLPTSSWTCTRAAPTACTLGTT